MLAHEKLIEKLARNYNLKSVNEFAQIAFSEALECFEEYYMPYIKQINESREKFIKELRDFEVTTGSGGYGNFVCVWVGGGKREKSARN